MIPLRFTGAEQQGILGLFTETYVFCLYKNNNNFLAIPVMQPINLQNRADVEMNVFLP